MTEQSEDILPLNDSLKLKYIRGFWGFYFTLERTRNDLSRSVTFNVKVAQKLLEKRDEIIEKIELKQRCEHHTGHCQTVFATVMFEDIGEWYCSIYNIHGKRRDRDPSRTINLSSEEFKKMLPFLEQYI